MGSQICSVVGRRGELQDTSRGPLSTRGHLCAPQSPLIFALLLTGSPGHSGSTSMSPSAALSTGKPMDSHPSYTDTPVSAPRTLSAVGAPLNALGSPYRVITSAMGPPSGALPAPPGINLVAPPSSQVGARLLFPATSHRLSLAAAGAEPGLGRASRLLADGSCLLQGLHGVCRPCLMGQEAMAHRPPLWFNGLALAVISLFLRAVCHSGDRPLSVLLNSIMSVYQVHEVTAAPLQAEGDIDAEMIRMPCLLSRSWSPRGGLGRCGTWTDLEDGPLSLRWRKRRKPPLIPRVSAATEGRERVRGRHVLAALRTLRVAGCHFLPAMSQRSEVVHLPFLWCSALARMMLRNNLQIIMVYKNTHFFFPLTCKFTLAGMALPQMVGGWASLQTRCRSAPRSQSKGATAVGACFSRGVSRVQNENQSSRVQ